MAARLLDAAFAVVYLRLLGRTDVGAYQFLVVFTTYLDTLAGFGLVGLAASSLLTNVVTAMVLWRLASRNAITSESGVGRPVAWLRESWPLFVNQLLQGLFFKIDALLLLPLGGAAAAGAYAAAYKVSEGAGIVSSSFTLAMFPRLARHGDLSAAYRMALRLLLQVGFPMAIGIALLSAPIVLVVGGREYLPDSAIAL